MPAHRKIRSLEDAMTALTEWHAEARLVSAVLVVAGDDAATFFAKGEIRVASVSRLQIVGWGSAAIRLSNGKVTSEIAAGLKESIVELHGGTPVNWPEVISLEFSNGNLLVLWSERQTASRRSQDS